MLAYPTNKMESYTQPFSLKKLKEPLIQTHNTVISPDEKHEFLKRFPEISLKYIIDIYTEIWLNCYVPNR